MSFLEAHVKSMCSDKHKCLLKKLNPTIFVLAHEDFFHSKCVNFVVLEVSPLSLSQDTITLESVTKRGTVARTLQRKRWIALSSPPPLAKPLLHHHLSLTHSISGDSG